MEGIIKITQKVFKKTISLIKRVFTQMNETDGFGLSAQLAYFFLLSLFPFLLFLITLLGYLPIDEEVVLEFIALYLPEEVAYMIEVNVNQLLNNRSGSLLSISIIGTLWSASNGFNAIKRALNRAYQVTEKRAFILTRIISIFLTIGMLVVICVALLLPVFGRVIGEYLFSMIHLSQDFENLWETLRWVLSSITFFIVLLVLYKFAPNIKVKWRHAIWGTLFATVGWQLVSFGFSYYVTTLGNYSASYGSLGTVIILMIWFYLSGLIIITGGIINAVSVKRIN